MRSRVNLLGVWIDRIDVQGAIAHIDGFVRSGSPRQIITANLEFLRLSNCNPSFRQLVNTADLVVADGMPLVWGSHLLGTPLVERVTGVEMVTECARLAAARNYSLFLLGAAPGVANQAAARLQALFPGLRIAGTYAPPIGPFGQQEEEKMVRMVQAAQPDFLFVAFGAPKQDQWIRAHMHDLGVPVNIGVGGSFDFLAGRVKRAPVWMQSHGLEWLFRFTQEPTRLWKRYFVDDIPVALRLLASPLFAHTTNDRPYALSSPGHDVVAGGQYDHDLVFDVRSVAESTVEPSLVP